MTDPDTLPMTRAQVERVLWREFQEAVAAADTVLVEHQAAKEYATACGTRWIEAFNRLGGA